MCKIFSSTLPLGPSYMLKVPNNHTKSVTVDLRETDQVLELVLTRCDAKELEEQIHSTSRSQSWFYNYIYPIFKVTFF